MTDRELKVVEITISCEERDEYLKSVGHCQNKRGNTMTYMVQLDMHGKVDAGDKRHAQEVMRDLGIRYLYAVPQSLGSCWMFFGVDKNVELPYDYLEMRKVDPYEFIGFGISKEMADDLASNDPGRTMDDRELLELAARAAGIEQGAERTDCGVSTTLPGGRHGHLPRWNPLTDDGDALRLAVELGIDIEWRADGRVAAYRHANADGHCFTAFESSREDRQKNTRRAIVRAAAEIGKTLGE